MPTSLSVVSSSPLPVLPYSVNLWESHPAAGNDDCCTGANFATLAEALDAAGHLADHFNQSYFSNPAYVEIDGPDYHEDRRNPAYKSKLTMGGRRPHDWDAEERSERAMQAGMAFGCDGYNDEMGFGYEPGEGY
jgi:hypothetical protein